MQEKQTLEIKASSTITVEIEEQNKMFISGCSISLENLDESDKEVLLNDDGNFNSDGITSAIHALKYGIANAITYGHDKGFWDKNELGQEVTFDILRIIEIDQVFSETIETKSQKITIV